jgi:hypothetical protein
MNRKRSEELVSRASAMWRYVGAVLAAVAMMVGGAPAFGADSNLSLKIVQKPAVFVNRGGGNHADFELVLTNNGPNTVNNILLYVNTAEDAVATSQNPLCTLAPVSSATCTVSPQSITLSPQTTGHPGFMFSVTQLANKGTATASVSFFTPVSGPMNVYGFAVGASTASTTKPAARTGVAADFYPLPALLNDVIVPPNVSITLTQADGPVFRSDATCNLALAAVDGCGFVNYNVKVTSNEPAPIVGTFYIDIKGDGNTVQSADTLLCEGACGGPTPLTPSASRFPITNLAPGAANSSNFVVQFTTPSAGNATISATPVFAGFTPVTPDCSVPNNPLCAVTSAFATYDETQVAGFQVPISTKYGGTIKRQKIDASTGGVITTTIKIPKDTLGAYKRGLNSSVQEFADNQSCSPSFKVCLGSEIHIYTNALDADKWQSSGNLSDPNNFILHIELTRDFKTFGSSGNALHSTVYYMGTDGVKVAVKDCGSVDTSDPTVIRCLRRTFVSLQKDKKNNYISGVVTFFIDARENGVYSW